MTEPLIFTSRGNVLVADLVYATRWEETPDYVKFVETYTLDGEVVKESAHVLSRYGMTGKAVAADLGG